MESVMPSSHLILYCPLLLLSSIFPSTRVFSNESARRIRWPKYWSFSFNITPSNEHSGLISFRMDWLDLLAVQGTLKSLLQYHSSKASWSWFPLSSLSTFLPSYPSQEMVVPCLYEKPKNHHRLMFTSCAIQEQTLIALSSKYIQSLTISHHLHWCHYVQATIISHLGHFCGPQKFPSFHSCSLPTTCSQNSCQDLWWLSSHWFWPTSHSLPDPTINLILITS